MLAIQQCKNCAVEAKPPEQENELVNLATSVLAALESACMGTGHYPSCAMKLEGYLARLKFEQQKEKSDAC